MKLYYSPGACSQAPHIVLHEIGLSHDSVRVDLKSKTIAGGGKYLEINPKGSVPALELDNGEVLTENAVILQYLGDRSGLGELLPSNGNFRRYRVLEWLNFITTELHKSFAPLFKTESSDETKAQFKKLIGERFDYVDAELGDGPFLCGKAMTLGDPYLFVMLGWGEKILGGLDRWPNLKAFRQHMLERESVRQVLRFEGLLEAEPAD